MPHPFFIVAIIVSLAAASPALAAREPATSARGRVLTCFSIRPSDAPTDGRPAGSRFPPQPPATYRSCDQLCAKKNAACVSLKLDGAVNPGFGCETPLDPLNGAETVTGCRCCALAR